MRVSLCFLALSGLLVACDADGRATSCAAVRVSIDP
jgi:hypothetical protein